MKVGIGYIGGVNYIKVITRNHPEGWAAAFLCKASGWRNGIKAARALAATGKAPIIEVHGMWRDDHHFKRKHIRGAVRQAKKVARLAMDYPDIEFYYSPWLEHRASNRLFDRCAEACEEVLPRDVPIVSCGGNYWIPEVHGGGAALRPPYIYAYDGTATTDGNIGMMKQRHKAARLFFLWLPECNGKKYASESISRIARVLRGYWLKKCHIEELERMYNR